MINYTIEQVYEKKIKPQNLLEAKTLSNTVTINAKTSQTAAATKIKKNGCC